MNITWQDIGIEQGARTASGCDCCGSAATVLHGDLIAPEGWLAFYTVTTAKGHGHDHLMFEIGTGDWSEDGAADHRWLFRAQYSPATSAFEIVDMPAGPDLRAIALQRDDIVGSDFAPEAAAMLDAILRKDTRLEGAGA